MQSTDQGRSDSDYQSRGLRLLEGKATLGELVDEALQERSSPPIWQPAMPQTTEGRDLRFYVTAAAATLALIVIASLLILVPSLASWTDRSAQIWTTFIGGVITAITIVVARRVIQLVKYISEQERLHLEAIGKISSEHRPGFERDLKSEIALERARADTIVWMLRVTPPGVSLRITPEGAIEVDRSHEESAEGSQLKASEA